VRFSHHSTKGFSLSKHRNITVDCATAGNIPAERSVPVEEQVRTNLCKASDSEMTEILLGSGENIEPFSRLGPCDD